MRDLITDDVIEAFINSFQDDASGLGGPDKLAHLVDTFRWPERGKTQRTYQETLIDFAPNFDVAKSLSGIIERGREWGRSDHEAAECLALRVFNWGGVTRSDPKQVFLVFRRALAMTEDDAPMNSGWTKVAAVATHHRENEIEKVAHVIWDSRVACSVVSRLDRIFHNRQVADLRTTWLGLIPGRTSTNSTGKRANFRPRCQWRTVYGKWEGQNAGSCFVRRVVDRLNEQGSYIGFGSGTQPWTVWSLGAALFVDGK
jgi:hypothetical protein